MFLFLASNNGPQITAEDCKKKCDLFLAEGKDGRLSFKSVQVARAVHPRDVLTQPVLPNLMLSLRVRSLTLSDESVKICDL